MFKIKQITFTAVVAVLFGFATESLQQRNLKLKKHN